MVLFFDDFERLPVPTQISRSRHYLTLNISETVLDFLAAAEYPDPPIFAAAENPQEKLRPP